MILAYILDDIPYGTANVVILLLLVENLCRVGHRTHFFIPIESVAVF